MNVCHIAIPTHDLDVAEDFYVRVLGATKARRYDDRVTFRFFDHQVVCHLEPDYELPEIRFYPRHFGMTFERGEDFDAVIERIRASAWTFADGVSTRFADLPERHRTCFLVDPSNNVIEFKHYEDHRFAY